MTMVMKKIAIITWIGNGNYGTCLQAFALHYKVKDMGYDTYILPSLSDFSKKKYVIKGYVKILFKSLGISFLIKKIKSLYIPLNIIKLKKFQSKYINIVEINTSGEKENFFGKIDVFIAGSDQICNTYYCFNPFFFLDFVKSKKKIAYASSIGTDSVNKIYAEKVKDLLFRFSHIGVREQTAVDVLSSLTGRDDIVQVSDPTFLLTKYDWLKVTEDAVFEFQLPEKYIFCYFIATKDIYFKQISDIKKRTGINKIIMVPSKESESFDVCNISDCFLYKNAGPSEFVRLIEKSELVCTDSFHATALSIILSKDFVDFYRFDNGEKESQNSRINNLLEHYNLKNRIYSVDSDEWRLPIDYDKVNKVLNSDKVFSEDYLRNAIER